MSWRITVAPQRSGTPLTPEQITAGMERPQLLAPAPASDPRPWLSARVAACRACEYVARGGQTCAACDLRCTHPLATERQPLLAEPASTCPSNLWPLAP